MHKRVAVIGAGPSGIAALKALLAEGHDAVAFEQGERIGGNWVFRPGPSHSSVCETTHIISSKRWSAFEDFPMPDDYPDYPSHSQVLAYFERYVAHFDLAPRIALETRVDRAIRSDHGGWTLQLSSTGVVRGEHFDAILVANGHHWDPFLPEVDGRFDGQVLHSHAFKRADPFRGLRVLVVGAGNSACDVAVELSRVAAHVGLSVRRGQHIVPKLLGGRPGDENNARLLWLPRGVRQWLLGRVLRLVQGRYSDYGLPEPEVGVFEMHPTVNSELLYFIRHGRIHPRAAIRSFDGASVVFADGAREAYDAVIFATGYNMRFPFLDPALVPWVGAHGVPLYRKMIPAAVDNLYFIGLFQPLGCIWPLADYQSRIAAREIAGRWQRPADLQVRIDREQANPHYRFQRSRRHATEVDYHRFRAELLAELG